MSLRTIFHDVNVSRFRDSHDVIHLAGPPCEMNWYYRSSARRQYARDGLCRYVARIMVYICEDRPSSASNGETRRGHERSRRNNDLITWANPASSQCHLEGHRPV